MVCYGTSADEIDESYQMSETVASNSLKDFCRLIVRLLGEEYLNRNPTELEKREILNLNKKRGFPGMFGSWDCKHFKWDKCPVRLSGQHKGKGGGKTLVLEAVADPNLYVWFSFFGEPGSLNDINILDKSPILGDIISQKINTKVDPYIINHKERDWMYFLADGIYPRLSIFGLAINIAENMAQEHYKKNMNT